LREELTSQFYYTGIRFWLKAEKPGGLLLSDQQTYAHDKSSACSDTQPMSASSAKPTFTARSGMRVVSLRRASALRW
jgi:hypothetical protein